MVKTARTNPAAFFATCARLIPNDVRVTVQQQLPGNLSAEDWAMMREIVEAVKRAIPDASGENPTLESGGSAHSVRCSVADARVPSV